ncbi:MAG: putative transport system permease protein [Candidatus Sumerlaeota bacterium]|nr:putative transport system permease protein [Candidatus Sumerlaeota bacterium]
MHKMRSFLTMLGVIFGIAAVIATSAIGAGAAEELNRQLAALGTNTIRIRALEIEGAERIAAQKLSPYGLTRDDVQALREVVPDIVGVAPLKMSDAKAFADGRTLPVEIYGTSADLPRLVGYRVAMARFLTEWDQIARNQVCVIGEDVRRTAFPLEDPIGGELRIAGQSYTVVGVLAPRRTGGETVIKVGNVDRNIYIPLDTLYQRLGTQEDPRADKLDEIILKVAASADLRETSNLVERLLLRRHKDIRDFEILVPEELIRQQQETSSILGNVLVFVAAISLLVGGIGIMNIMLASVTQRTREIGVRRALGATRNDILGQFVIESLIISLLGGILGLGTGYGLAYSIKLYANWEMIVPIKAVIIATAVSGGVGLVFGLYPSMKAARLDPIEALRSE